MLKQLKNDYVFVLFYLLLALINGIFVFKYGLRYKPLSLIILIYAGLVGCQVSILIFCFKTKYIQTARKNFYWIIAILFFLLTVFINYQVDGQNLNVDRWSAMHVGIKTLLAGEYPYTAVDHLGGRTSNLPSLLLLGIPFYLLGDVGYLQSFTFLLFALLIYKLFKSNAVRFIILFLLISSPCYLYEIYVKSDLISNFIILLLFVLFSFEKLKEQPQKRPFLWGLAASLVLYSRLTAVIPLILTFFSRFFSWSVRNRILFILGGLLTLVMLSVLVFMHYPSVAVLIEKNPFVLQNRQLPFLLSILFILLPCFFSYKIQTLHSLMFYCVLLLALPVFTSLGLYMATAGIWPAVRDSRFDLSYLNIITPFLIVYLGCVLQENPPFLKIGRSLKE